MRELIRGRSDAFVYEPHDFKMVEHEGVAEIEVFNPRFPSKKKKVVRKNFTFEVYEKYGTPLTTDACVFLHHESSDYITPQHPWMPPMKARMPLSADVATHNTPVGASYVTGALSDENIEPILSGDNMIATASRTWTNLQALDLTERPREVHALTLAMLVNNPVTISGLQPYFNPYITIPASSSSSANSSDIVPDIPRLDRFSDGNIYQISMKNSIIARKLNSNVLSVFRTITNAEIKALSLDFTTAAFCVPSNEFIYIMGYNSSQSATILHVKKYDSPETMNLMKSWTIDTTIGGSTAAICFNAISGRFVKALAVEGNGEIHLFGQIGSNATSNVPNNDPLYVASPNTVKTLDNSRFGQVDIKEGAVTIPFFRNISGGWAFGKDISTSSGATANGGSSNLAMDKIWCFLDLFEGRYLRYSLYVGYRSAASSMRLEGPSIPEYLYDIQEEKIIGCRPAYTVNTYDTNANDLAIKVCDNTGYWPKIEKTQNGARYARSTNPVRVSGTGYFWEIMPTPVNIAGLAPLCAHLKDDGTWPQRITEDDFLKVTYSIISKSRIGWPAS